MDGGTNTSAIGSSGMQPSLFSADGTAALRVGLVHLHFGDWRDVVDSWPRDGVPVFDPPYGIDHTSNQDGRFQGVRIVNDMDTSERDEFLSRSWSAAAVFGPARLDRVPLWGNPRAVLIWDKGDAAGMGDLSFPWRPNYETIAVYGNGWTGKRTTSVLRGVVPTWSGAAAMATRQHPHEKPLAVLAELIGKAPPRRDIIDPFTGSGSAIIAAALSGRDVWAAEIDPRYHEVILGRLAANRIEVEMV
jgi:hypothetical protein